MFRVITFFLLFIFTIGMISAQVFDMVVDDDGTGDYTSINEALSAVPNNSSDRTLIFIKNGTYNEKIWLTADKTNVSIIGENVNSVIIDWDDYQGKVVDGASISGADSYTFLVEGEDFYMENLTIKNSAGKVGQAVAIRTIGDRTAFKNCQFLGNQDTYYAHKRRQYNYKCTVEGNTDFIYGDATTVFDSCEIRSVPGGSYITAPADAKLITNFTTGDFYHGLLFRYCNVTAAEGVSDNSVYLGRPWQPRSSSVFIECVLGNHIKPQGWSTWSGDNHLSSVFAEYQSMTPDGELVDVSQRASWSYQLEASKLNRYALKFFLHNSGSISEYWDPVPMVTPLYHPQNLTLQGNTLSWDAVTEAMGYVVCAQDGVLAFTETNSYTMVEAGGLNDYKVLSVDDYGALSDGSVSVNTSIKSVQKDGFEYIFVNNAIHIKERVNIDVFNAKGIKVKTNQNTSFLSLTDEPTGLYIVVLENNMGIKKSFKIVTN